MAVTLGKRKRRDEVEDEAAVETATTASHEQLKALLQRHFEAKFRPLEGRPKTKAPKVAAETQIPSNDDNSDWDGLSEDTDGPQPIVVVHNTSSTKRAEVPLEELKTFMTPKPPSTPTFKTIPRSKPKTKPANESEDPATETALLKNDLELQRLLSESHLLTSSAVTSTSTSSLTLTGAARHKALDLRLQALGSKTSILAQQKMPRAHRVGIEAKAVEREERRRKEAKENGIVLERERDRGKGKTRGKRERGVGGPGVGSFRGATLKLSQKDVRAIEGPRGGVGKRGRVGARGRGGGAARGKRK